LVDRDAKHPENSAGKRPEHGWAKCDSEPAAIDQTGFLLAPQSFMAERFKILRTNLLYLWAKMRLDPF